MFGSVDLLRTVVRRARREDVRIRVAAVVESEIVTLAVLIGARFVPATSQVTVCVEPR